MGATSSKPRTKKSAAKTPKASKEKKEAAEKVVFAFRLTAEERELIHRAAGSGKGTRFVRGAALAAANGDAKAFQELTGQATANLK